MVVKSAVDTNTYRTMVLENGTEVILVSNPMFTKASFALSVRVGSFDEPADFPGLAHFLEHMLFMGTENYPGENDFMNFLNMHNGYTNAYTADEMTVYYCDIDASEQDKLADMFSSFFTCPLFIRDAVNREISAVDSEYLNSLTNSPWRMQALLGELLKEGETRGKFGCGNAETLRQDNIWETVVGFWKERYSSDLMKLVICSNAEFPAMEGLAMRFAKIRKAEGAAQRYASREADGGDSTLPAGEPYVGTSPLYGLLLSDYCSFDPKYFRKIIQMAPLDDLKELLIFVDLPPLFSHFRKNPLSLIDFVFTSPEPAGLLAQLKTEGLAYTLSLEFEYFTHSTRVRIRAELTGLGCSEYRRILDMVAAHLNALQAGEREFARLKRVQEEEFSIQQPDEPLDLVVSLTSAMQNYPAENAINHSYVYESYDGDLIRDLVGRLADHSRWVIVVSDNNGTFTHKEKYYSVEYAIVGEYEAGGQPQPQPAPADLSAEDRYVDSMKLIELGQRFVRIEKFGQGRISYVFDQDFAVPRCEVFVQMQSDALRDSFVEIQLYLSLAEDAFTERYARELYNFHITVRTSVSHDGAVVHFQGVSSKMGEMCELFFREFYRMRSERFALFRRQLEDFYTAKITKAPFGRLMSTLTDSVSGLSSYEENLVKLREISENAIECPEWSAINLLAVGNIQYADVCAIYNTAVAKDSSATPGVCGAAADGARPGGSPAGQPPARCRLDVGGVASFVTHDRFNNGLGIFYKIADLEGHEAELEAFVGMGSDDVAARAGELLPLRDIAIGRLIHQICSEDFFNQLRTTEELGYCVCSRVRTVGRQQYLGFLVQSQQTVEFLEARILRFVEDLKTTIRDMDEETFSTYRGSLIGWYEEPLLNLSVLSSSVWSQTVSAAVDLDFNRKMASIVETLKIEDLLGSSMLDRYLKVHSVSAA